MSLNTNLSKTRISFDGADWDEAVRLAQQAVKDQASNKGKECAEAISIHPLTPTPEVKELSPTKKSKIELAQRITSARQELHNNCNIYLSSLRIPIDIFKSSYEKMIQPLATRFFF